MSDAGSTGRGRHAAEPSSEADAREAEALAETSGEYTDTDEKGPRETDVEGEYIDTDGAAPISREEKGSYVDTATNDESGPEGEYTDKDE